MHFVITLPHMRRARAQMSWSRFMDGEHHRSGGASTRTTNRPLSLASIKEELLLGLSVIWKLRPRNARNQEQKQLDMPPGSRGRWQWRTTEEGGGPWMKKMVTVHKCHPLVLTICQALRYVLSALLNLSSWQFTRQEALAPFKRRGHQSLVK